MRCGHLEPPAGAPAPVTYASASRAHATVVTSDFISTPRVGDVLAVGRNDAKNAGFVQRLSGEQQVRQVSLDCVFRSAVSQSVRQLEEQLRVVLLPRATRSVALTDAGRCLVETAGPALAQALAALTDVSAQPGETVGRVRLSVSRSAVPFVITPVLPTFRARHARVEVEVAVEDRLVNIVAEGYDASNLTSLNEQSVAAGQPWLPARILARREPCLTVGRRRIRRARDRA